MNLDKVEQIEYQIVGFTAYELYPFYTQKTKRIFRGYRHDIGNQVYRIVLYPHSLVHPENLISHLKICKEQSSPILGKTKYLYEEVNFTKVDDKADEETVIAAVIQDRIDSEFISLYQLLIEINSLSEKLAKQFLFQIMQFIQSMQISGISQCFSPYDVYVDKISGAIRIDNYGDRHYFKVKDQVTTDCWQIGAFLYTCLYAIPPYNSKSQSDPHFLALKQNNFNKFWSLNRDKPSNEIVNFINTCFSSDCKLEDLFNHNYCLNYSEISGAEKVEQIKNCRTMKEAKQAAAVQKRKSRKDKISKFAHSINSLDINRFSQDQFVKIFLEKLKDEENSPRNLSHPDQQPNQQQQQHQNIQIAYLLSILISAYDEDPKIYAISDNKTNLEFRISSTFDNGVEVNTRVVVDFIKKSGKVKLLVRELEGSAFETMWGNAIISKLLQELQMQ